MSKIKIEKAVLGAFMIDCECVTLYYKLKDYRWEDKRNYFIYDAIRHLLLNGQPVDVITICEQLAKDKRIDKVTRDYVLRINKAIATTAHVDYHINVLLGKTEDEKMGKKPSVGIDPVVADAFKKMMSNLSDEWVDVKMKKGTCAINLTKAAAEYLDTADIDDIVLTLGGMFEKLGKTRAKTPSVRVYGEKEISFAEILKKFCNEKKIYDDVRQPMTLNEYQKKASTTCLETSDNNGYCLLGLAEEVGEVMGKVAKGIRKGLVRFDKDNNLVMPVNDDTKAWKESLKKELGDVMWMVSQTARTMGWSLEEICKDNLAKLADRKERSVIDSEGDNR